MFFGLGSLLYIIRAHSSAVPLLSAPPVHSSSCFASSAEVSRELLPLTDWSPHREAHVCAPPSGTTSVTLTIRFPGDSRLMRQHPQNHCRFKTLKDRSYRRETELYLVVFDVNLLRAENYRVLRVMRLVLSIIMYISHSQSPGCCGPLTKL